MKMKSQVLKNTNINSTSQTLLRYFVKVKIKAVSGPTFAKLKTGKRKTLLFLAEA